MFFPPRARLAPGRHHSVTVGGIMLLYPGGFATILASNSCLPASVLLWCRTQAHPAGHRRNRRHPDSSSLSFFKASVAENSSSLRSQRIEASSASKMLQPLGAAPIAPRGQVYSLSVSPPSLLTAISAARRSGGVAHNSTPPL
jgi:hypothetical protein